MSRLSDIAIGTFAAFEKQGRLDEGLDAIHQIVGDDLREESGRMAEDILKDPRTVSLGLDYLLCLLVVTKPYRDQLPSRKSFCDSVQLILKARQEQHDKILQYLDV